MAGMADRKDKTWIEADILRGPSPSGLFQRYVVASLYNPRDSTRAGLEPVQSITIATPHSGMRGSKSVCFRMPSRGEAISPVGGLSLKLKFFFFFLSPQLNQML
jgi:hypothetical protein